MIGSPLIKSPEPVATHHPRTGRALRSEWGLSVRVGAYSRPAFGEETVRRENYFSGTLGETGYT